MNRHPVADQKSARFVFYGRAAVEAFRKLDPRLMYRNPTMLVVELTSLLTTGFWLQQLLAGRNNGQESIGSITLWLWFTVLFANFAEAVAEGRGRAQADSLRRLRSSITAKQVRSGFPVQAGRKPAAADVTRIPGSSLCRDDFYLVEAGDLLPVDGEVAAGIASVDESAVTGESAPVIRESGGDRSAVTGGTRILSDWLVVKVTALPGEGFIDRMIQLIEGSSRRKTPNEIALNQLLTGLTLAFLIVCATLLPFSLYSVRSAGRGEPISITVLVALLVCLIPTTIGGLLSAIGIAGMDRLIRRNVIAFSGRAVEAAGDVSILLLDKTGTITFGNRQAVEFIPLPGITAAGLASAAQLASLADETPEGRSIVVLAKERFGLRERTLHEGEQQYHFYPFSARTRMSGVDLDGVEIRKGAPDAILAYVQSHGHSIPPELEQAVARIAGAGGTPLAVARNGQPLGVIQLKDVVKGGIRERFARLRQMGIQTVMITGDNPLTAAAIAAEAGVDGFLAEARPEDKLRMIRDYQGQGFMVAMTGDGTNDAPALAQADVAVAMNTGTQPAREAANMIDLDSSPAKLIDIVEIGKQLLMTRGALTTFSIANDAAKYFAIIPAMFTSTYPAMASLNILQLQYPVLSAVIFNALIIILLIPLALRGVACRFRGAAGLFGRNVLIYGLGGLLTPFLGIKAIDWILAFCS